MCSRIVLLLWLCLAQSVLALPVGQWRSDFYGAFGNIDISEKRFEFRLESDQDKWAFSGPLALVVEPADGVPGKLVVGPVTDGDSAYEVIWFYPPTDRRVRFYRESGGYKTLAEAQDSKPTFLPSEAATFLAKDYFAECDALPTLPEPSKAELVVLLQEAVRRMEADKGSDVNTLMETLMIDKGFHPSRSKEPFEAAVQKYSEDPEVSVLIEKMES